MTSSPSVTARSDSPVSDDVERAKRELLRHAVATLAYRGAKAIRAAPPTVGGYRAGEVTRTPLQLVAHLGDLLEWALSLAEGDQRWNVATPGTWEEESTRFFTALARFDAFLAGDRPLGCSVERLLQGPVAAALTHVGQIAMLRRLANAPVRSENFFIAGIVAGRVGDDQAPPKYEFD
jgi:hypothetical protein